MRIRDKYPFATYAERVSKQELLEGFKEVKKLLLEKNSSYYSYPAFRGYYLCFIIEDDMKISDDLREDLYGYMVAFPPDHAKKIGGGANYAWASMNNVEVRLNWLNETIKKLEDGIQN